jgi:hypothetical protein
MREVAPYEIAAARIRVLTGVPWVGRRAESTWPQQFIDLATHGLTLDAGEAKVVELMSIKLATGVHDVEPSLTLLRECQERHRLAALVDAFEALNDGAERTAEIAAHMRRRFGLDAGSGLKSTPSTLPPPTLAPVSTSTRVTVMTAARPPKAMSPTESNGRDLGALEDLFK